MIDTPIVSVLMTAYNREKYITAAIESVLASSFKDFELIIVDDASSDQSLQIAKQFQSIDPRVLVYSNQVNLGDYPNRNQAASYAKGKYLKYVDADDKIYPWGLEIMINTMEKYPQAGYGLCSVEQDTFVSYPVQLSNQEAYTWHYFDKGIFSRAPLSSIIKRDIFISEQGFKNQRMSGDFEMWHRLSLKYPVVIMPQGMVWYRRHNDQEINHFSKYEFSYYKISIDYLSDDSCPLDVERRKEAYKNSIKMASLQLLKHLFKYGYIGFVKQKNYLGLSISNIIRSIFS